MNRRDVIAAAAVAGLAGCLGDGDDGTTETRDPTTETDETVTAPGSTETVSDAGTETEASGSETTETIGETTDASTTTVPLVDDGGGEPETPSIDEFLSDVSNYDGVEDHTGESEVTVDVGVETDRGYYGFGPAAIRVTPGTTVTWEWTGRGQQHDVTATYGGEFESELTAEEGHTFTHAFEEPGTALYVCTPHQGLGMKGAVVVE